MNEIHGGNIYNKNIKFDFSVNVNPFTPGWKSIFAFFLSLKSLKNYPDIESKTLKNALSKKYNVSKEKILVGNGASEIIFSTVRAINPKKVLLLSPCFSGYNYAINSLDEFNSSTTKIIYFPLNEKNNFELFEKDICELKKIIKEEKPDIFFFCNPNNPNGKLYPRKTIFQLLDECQNSQTKVLLDECFMELTGKEKDFSMIFASETFEKYSNLIIVNALTKTFAIPGLRLGFGFCSSKEMAEKIKMQMPEWNVSVPAQKMGTVLLENNRNALKKKTKPIEKERTFLENALLEAGFKVYPSDANFILFYSEKIKDLKEKLLKKQILIRDCSNYVSLCSGFYRIAVKKHKENRILIRELKKCTMEKN